MTRICFPGNCAIMRMCDTEDGYHHVVYANGVHAMWKASRRK